VKINGIKSAVCNIRKCFGLSLVLLPCSVFYIVQYKSKVTRDYFSNLDLIIARIHQRLTKYEREPGFIEAKGTFISSFISNTLGINHCTLFVLQPTEAELYNVGLELKAVADYFRPSNQPKRIIDSLSE